MIDKLYFAMPAHAGIVIYKGDARSVAGMTFRFL